MRPKARKYVAAAMTLDPEQAVPRLGSRHAASDRRSLQSRDRAPLQDGFGGGERGFRRSSRSCPDDGPATPSANALSLVRSYWRRRRGEDPTRARQTALQPSANAEEHRLDAAVEQQRKRVRRDLDVAYDDDTVDREVVDLGELRAVALDDEAVRLRAKRRPLFVQIELGIRAAPVPVTPARGQSDEPRVTEDRRPDDGAVRLGTFDRVYVARTRVPAQPPGAKGGLERRHQSRSRRRSSRTRRRVHCDLRKTLCAGKNVGGGWDRDELRQHRNERPCRPASTTPSARTGRASRRGW